MSVIITSSKNHKLLFFLLSLTVFLTFIDNGLSLSNNLSAGPLNYESNLEKKYNQAKDYYYLLLRDKNIQGKRSNWQKGISAFRKIYHLEPHGELAPNALFMIAKMHYRMYMLFHQKGDLDDSISNYNGVHRNFPGNSLADDALFWTGEIYLKDKRNLHQAAKIYAKQITLYPEGDKFALAASRLSEIQKQLNVTLPEKYASAQDVKKLIDVLPVKYMSSDNYTRVVIRSSGPVRYKSSLSSKNGKKFRKLLIDFDQSSVAQKYTSPINIDDGLLKKIHTEQYDPTTVRVSLDIESISTYKIFSLNDPFRVIIDAYGQENILSTSKKLPLVGSETLAVSRRQTSSSSLTVIKPTSRKKPKGESHNNTDLAQDNTFIVLKSHSKKKPVSPRRKTGNADTTLTLAQQLGLGVKRIVLDPGHGGKDPGAMAYGLREKDITLQVARKVATLLRDKYQYEVILTRDDDSSLPVEDRPAIAYAKKADLFVSIHVNAHPSKKVRGIETFFLNLATNNEAMRVAARENATTTHNISDMQDILSDLMQNSKIQESSLLAEYVQNSLISGLQENKYVTADLGVKQAPFYVLIGAEMPAILAEISFLSNKDDAALLRSENYLKTIAGQIAKGIAGYTENRATAAL